MNLAENQRQLVEQYSEYVVRIAKQIKRTLSPNIETDDLIGYGMTGLIEAADRYNPSVGANFSTFSYYRIRGAIYDGLRVMGSLSRTEYRRQRFEEKASMYMESESLRTPSTAQSSPDDELNKMAQKVQRMVTIYVTSLSEKDIHGIADNDSEKADDRMQRLQLYEKMKAAIGKLSKSDQEIINAYYFEDKSLEEVGKGLGLSKSWTCRKHARALEKLSDVFFTLIKDPK
ncbi:MAG: sigma-70 family RNA polymerase sigma factor [Myxococcales bacterium]|nr:sigma-70 family RNA polymerase sigma factor [Myxococcales bacterium]USN51707.1 MAG: sigma-70 family RNA polymerase sigma factor [Myxococcales bacterium]